MCHITSSMWKLRLQLQLNVFNFIDKLSLSSCGPCYCTSSSLYDLDGLTAAIQTQDTSFYFLTRISVPASHWSKIFEKFLFKYFQILIMEPIIKAYCVVNPEYSVCTL